MRKTLIFVLATLAMLASTVSSIAAQEATPEATTGGITVVGSDGQPVGTMTVNEIQDPFTGFDPSSPPPRGFHYVGVNVTADATGAMNASGSFSLADVDGFVYSQSYLYRSNSDSEPDFDGSAVAPGNPVTGWVFFEVLQGVDVGLVFFLVNYDQVITIADLRDGIVEPGATVSVLANDGQPSTDITVNDFQNPFEAYDPSSPPQRGFDYVAAVVTVENLTGAPITVDPSQFQLYDVDGFNGVTTSILRSEAATAALPDLSYGTVVDVGQSFQGFLGFEVLADTEEGYIAFVPSSDRHVRVSEYGEGTPAPAADEDTSGAADAEPTRPAPPPANTNPPATAAVNCTEAKEWATATAANINSWSETFTELGRMAVSDIAQMDVALIEQAQEQLDQLATDQAALDVPGGAEEINEDLVQAFEDSSAAVDDLLTAIETQDQAAMGLAYMEIGEASAAFSSPEIQADYDALVVVCPELSEVGM